MKNLLNLIIFITFATALNAQNYDGVQNKISSQITDYMEWHKSVSIYGAFDENEADFDSKDLEYDANYYRNRSRGEAINLFLKVFFNRKNLKYGYNHEDYDKVSAQVKQLRMEAFALWNDLFYVHIEGVEDGNEAREVNHKEMICLMTLSMLSGDLGDFFLNRAKSIVSGSQDGYPIRYSLVSLFEIMLMFDDYNEYRKSSPEFATEIAEIITTKLIKLKNYLSEVIEDDECAPCIDEEDIKFIDDLILEMTSRRRATQIADTMNIKTLAAQVILAAIEGKATLTPKTRELLVDIPAGGILLFSHNLATDAEKNRTFIKELSNYMSGITLPPFIASDQEGGAVQRIKGKASLPSPLSYWQRLKRNNADTVISAIEREANQAARELRRIGITLNLAPLAEVQTTENKIFLKERSYGPDPIFTVNAAAAFIRGMESNGIASTLKHFPGNSSTDPHHHKAVLNASETELKILAEPFKELIRRETPASVMLSHVIVPLWDSLPLTRSHIAVKHLREMGFCGIIMADDFAMAALGAAPEIAAVEALTAGVDMIIVWSKDMQKIYAAILTALDMGVLSTERIKDAAEQVIYQKIRYGVF
ncbi:MAG: hypothetical protein LBP96_00465 [Bacteroidales bacterium]|nr:hypothetical protein [Bacteroidales bacterium]